MQRFRIAFGAVIAALAVVLLFNVDEGLAKAVVPDVFAGATSGRTPSSAAPMWSTIAEPAHETASAALPDYGPAPSFAGVDDWLNSRPLTMQELRGKVVLIDFWTYSCIN